MTGALGDILVIEDDQWLGEQHQRVLRAAGYPSRWVANALDGMDMIDAAPPRAIILDVLLPGTTAFALLHELQSHGDIAQVPIILCTSLASELELAAVAPYGVRRILDKVTMHPGDVVTAVRSVLL